MKNKKKRVFCRVLIITLFVITSVVVSLAIVFIKNTWNTSLDVAKLETVQSSNNIKIFDGNGEAIDTKFMFSSSTFVDLEELPNYVKQAFIVTEDKRFYDHNGVDYKRVVGAVFNNIKNKSFSQGASTISQQLIKNTHLSSEKTIKRKMKEIKLAYDLEKKYSKDEILEMYLNNIYFGNGCYGLEKASNYYFNKNAKDLTLGESALLAGVINAPSYYDPIKKNSSAENRKKLVLNLLKKQGVITNDDCDKSAKNIENISKTTQKPTNSHIRNIFNESCRVLNVSKNRLKNMSLNIETYVNSDLQNSLFSIILDKKTQLENINKNVLDIGVMVIDNKNKSVSALANTSGVDLIKTKRQPGSVIKPILVYAPAFEYGLIYPESVVIDEKINIDGYSPSNANKTFAGAVSIREAISKSLNIPAVKTLSKVGIKRAKNFAENLGIIFSNNDKNLALALGGMTDGVSIKQIADAYSTFATDGEYKASSLIKRITDDNGNVLYEDNKETKKVMSSATANLITDCLKDVVKYGTARRLNVYDFEVASKTGTVGLSSSDKNTDAYSVVYTSDHTIVVWIGSVSSDSSLNKNINGSTYPTLISKDILSIVYKSSKPQKFIYGDDVVYKFVDKKSLSNGFVELANDSCGIKNKKLTLFNKNHLPEYSKNKEIIVPLLEVSMEYGEKPSLLFESKYGFEYVLCRCDMYGEEKQLFTVKNEEKVQKYTDNIAKSGEIYEYYVKVKLLDVGLEKSSNKIKLMSF